MKKITIYDYTQGKNEHHTLTAEINEKGDLVLSGYDSGESVRKRFGDFDFEYWTTIRAENVPEVLLHLLKERFQTNGEFKEWLEKKNIPYEVMSF